MTLWPGKESLVGTALVTNDNDMVLILGDFNARVGSDSVAWKGVIGRHSVGNCNDNDMVLILVTSMLELGVTLWPGKESLVGTALVTVMTMTWS